LFWFSAILYELLRAAIFCRNCRGVRASAYFAVAFDHPVRFAATLAF